MLVAVLVSVLVTLAGIVLLLVRQMALQQSTSERFVSTERAHERVERGLREEMARAREESRLVLRDLGQTLDGRLAALAKTVDDRLQTLQTDNGQKLEQMRATVDEKLQGTLERRLGESFKLVSDRLELVHKGLGEMQSLAAGVGDLRKVLTNVKTRGTWGEVQLGNLLEQVLAPEQYAVNVATIPGSRERVEFAIQMPGHEAVTWLPIDSKFPQEDYQRLVDASERGDAAMVEQAGRALEQAAKKCAGDIRDKYVQAPYTVDFGLMFVPTEGLYAELVRRPGLADTLQRDFRIVLVGPTTLCALLNSLQMGFRTLALQKRSSEVWTVLGAVKTEFGKFSDVLDRVQKKLNEASNTIDSASARTKAIQRKLKAVEEMPTSSSTLVAAGGDTVLLGPRSGKPRTRDSTQLSLTGE